MWIVQLQHRLNYPFYGTTEISIVCGCDTEEAAHVAGRLAVKYYNGWPWWPLDGSMAGCASLSLESCFDHPAYYYSVKYHEGEWKGNATEVTP